MTDALDIHAASSDEIVAAHRNVHDIWSKGRNLENHVRHRLESPTHRRAEWYVGCLEGRVVTSLAAHPVGFRILGQDHSGIAIGSVYTIAEARGRGHAPRLIAWVEDQHRRRGTGLSMLYSDVKPDYYARQGYVLCPSWEGWRDAREPVPPSPHRLVAFAVDQHLATVKTLYSNDYGTLPLSIARDDAYWTMMLEKFADDQFYALQADDGNWRGYVLIGCRGKDWHIVDYALVDPTDVLAESFYAALCAAAQRAGIERVGGWMPESRAARKFFQFAPRATEITMIKPLAWDGTLSEAMIAGSSRVCELDHV